MKNLKKAALSLAVMAGFAVAGIVNAGTLVEGEITGNEIWDKAGSPYHLKNVVYVVPGASLTIEAGVVVASYVADEGSLAVCRDADLFVMGTQQEPVIMTSANDVATWDGSVVTKDVNGDVTEIIEMGNSRTGYWRPVCTEWGSLAILGKGYISASHYDDLEVTWTDGSGSHTNSKCPGAMNRKTMEGLVAAFTGDTRILYGGDDDDDDSGEIHYLSLRYGGNDVEFQKELNGISLGAIGRGTDIDHIEVMNNVDDGIEIWGGTVELSYVNIWNIGDDSFDVDEGWRGSVDRGLIVQGYSQQKKQGSGVGDNAFETDGAEDADAQPVTTAKVSNFTVVGQPGTASNNGSDAGTAWRDNARVQYDNCIWMDLDDHIIKFDCQDGDGANGYDGDDDDGTKNKSTSDDGTLSWDQHWTTSYNAWKASGAADPAGCGIDFANLYEAYVSTDLDGNLCQITNSVFYGDNIKYSEYDRLAGLAGSNFATNEIAVSMPIMNLQRDGSPVLIYDSKQDAELSIEPVAFINPLPAPGVTAGGFGGCNWLAGWTAADAFGMTDTSMNGASADLNCDGTVNLADLANFSGQWLK